MVNDQSDCQTVLQKIGYWFPRYWGLSRLLFLCFTSTYNHVPFFLFVASYLILHTPTIVFFNNWCNICCNRFCMHMAGDPPEYYQFVSNSKDIYTSELSLSPLLVQVVSQDQTPLLYSLVFEEGVVNDAAFVVLFNSIQSFDLTNINFSIGLQFIGNFLNLFF